MSGSLVATNGPAGGVEPSVLGEGGGLMSPLLRLLGAAAPLLVPGGLVALVRPRRR